MESLLLLIVGVMLILIGLANRRGNISMLHAYHRKRVTEEDRLPFGRLVGLGMITIGATMLISAALTYIASSLQESIYEILAYILTGVGLVVGIGISFYAMFKYNKGIF